MTFANDVYHSQEPHLSAENLLKTLTFVDRIIKLVRNNDIRTSRLMLAWLLAQDTNTFPIPGITKVNKFKESLDSLFVKLS